MPNKYKNEKLRVFREWAKGEKSGKGRNTTITQIAAQQKGQEDLMKKLSKPKRKPKGK